MLQECDTKIEHYFNKLFFKLCLFTVGTPIKVPVTAKEQLKLLNLILSYSKFAYFFVRVTSLRATPFGVRGPENTNLLTSFLSPESMFWWA